MIADRQRDGRGGIDRRVPAAWMGAAAASALAWAHRGAPAGLWLAGSAALCAFLVPAVSRLARRLGATVLPGGRSIHSLPTPRLGGFALFVPVAAALLATGGGKEAAILAGTVILLLAGALDDVRGSSPGFKLGAQTLAALALVSGGFRVPILRCAPFGDLATGRFEAPLLVFWVLLATNAVNLIDGLDGLASGVALLGAAACLALGAPALPAAALAGGLIGFLRWNLPRARIFLGDAGSLVVGFLLAALLLELPGGPSLPVCLGVLALPLGDVGFSALRRFLRGKPIFAADRGHVHHVLLHFWGRPGRVLVAILLAAAAQTTVIVLVPDFRGLAAAALFWVGFGVFLVARKRPRWRRIFGNRRGFQRAHLVRRYAQDALRLAESPEDVRAVLERVSADFQLAALEVGPVRLGSAAAAEAVECGSGRAGFALRPTGEDPVLTEEKRTILCDLLRTADDRLRLLVAGRRPGPRPPPAEAERGFGLRLPRVHFLVGDRSDLLRVDPLVQEARRRGAVEASIVHFGRRDDLGAFEALLAEGALVEPDVDLDVPDTADADHARRVIARYESLLEVESPSVVVVAGSSGAAVGCALVAKRRGASVAHVPDAPSSGSLPAELNGVFTGALSDLTVLPEETGHRRPTPLDHGRIVPAIERLAEWRPTP